MTAPGGFILYQRERGAPDSYIAGMRLQSVGRCCALSLPRSPDTSDVASGAAVSATSGQVSGYGAPNMSSLLTESTCSALRSLQPEWSQLKQFEQVR